MQDASTAWFKKEREADIDIISLQLHQFCAKFGKGSGKALEQMQANPKMRLLTRPDVAAVRVATQVEVEILQPDDKQTKLKLGSMEHVHEVITYTFA